MNRVKVAIAYSGTSARFMVPGASARIYIPAYSDEQFTGKIDKVSPTLNPETRLFNAEIMLDNENYSLRPGMFAKVIFSIDPHPNALLIPKSSVIYRAGNREMESMEAAETAQSTYVFVVQDGIAHMREVTLGHVSETEVEIRSGLKPDARVVTLGLHKIKDGDRISIVDDGLSMGGNTH
jgi:RND family efflux transporter MFP subunit